MGNLPAVFVKKNNKKFAVNKSQNQIFMASPAQRQITWRTDILPKATQKALELLSREAWLKKAPWYLAGGTSLALQAGHRGSVDLDFFTTQGKFNNSALLARLNSKNWLTTTNEEGTIYGELLGAKVSFIAYSFFKPALPFLCFGNVKVLQARDIAAMKVIAISQRGKKRDFFDLYWCCKNIESLEEIVLRLKTQYPDVAHDFHHILKSLTYFVDAQKDPLPKILFKASWPEVKKFFQKEVPVIAKKIIALN